MLKRPSTPSAAIRPLVCLTFALLPLLAAGCADPPVDSPLTQLQEGMVLEEPVLLVPGSRWSVEEAPAAWKFVNRGALLVFLREPLPQPLEIRLEPDKATRRHFITFAWDGAELPPEQIERGDAGFVVKLRPEQLAAGSHRLTLGRDYSQERASVRRRAKNTFPKISYTYASASQALNMAQLPRYQFLARFLQQEVAGKGRERRGGLLFMGALSRSVELSRRERSTLRFEPQNLSQARATFRIAQGDGTETHVDVEPGALGELVLPLAAGAHQLTLSVEGGARGLYLWGLPVIASPTKTAALHPIILITLDTTRRDAIGLYNGRPDLTPELEQLAAGATVYERAYSTAPWTLPSHASIFTGLYPSKHGAGVRDGQLLEGAATLARRLREQGYLTAGFSSGDLSSSRFGLAQGFGYYRDPDHFETPGEDLAGYVHDFLAAHAGPPLFLFVNYFDAHALYQAPPEFAEKLGVPALAEKLRGQPVWQELLEGKMSSWRQVVEGEVEASPAALAYLRAAYQAEVSYTDSLLGRLFAQLRELGLYDRALIVVTADHGELLGEGGFFSHVGRLDPELVEVPLIIKWPGQRQGQRDRRLVSLVDLYPTILGVAGLAPPPTDGLPLPAEGKSDGQKDAAAHSYVLLEEHNSIVHPLPPKVSLASHAYGVERLSFRQLVWDEQQACARREGEAWRTVACESDPAQVLAAILAQLGRRPGSDAQGPVPEELTESLKALGYM